MTIEAELAETRAMLASVMVQLERLTTPVRPVAYKIDQVGPVLGVSRSKVDEMIASGELPVVILPTMGDRRVPAAAVEALVAPDRWLTVAPA